MDRSLNYLPDNTHLVSKMFSTDTVALVKFTSQYLNAKKDCLALTIE